MSNLRSLIVCLQAVYKGVRQLVRKALQRAGERVLDVQGDDDGDDFDETSPDYVKKEH